MRLFLLRMAEATPVKSPHRHNLSTLNTNKRHAKRMETNHKPSSLQEEPQATKESENGRNSLPLGRAHQLVTQYHSQPWKHTHK